MNVYGLQKLTLIDFPEKMACTVFTGGCNLRCPFCHNAPLITPDAEGIIEHGKIISFLKSRKDILDGVCVTGGEPLLNPDIADFLAEIKSLGFLIKLDTNGCFPDRLARLTERRLIDYVAMDIKNSWERYLETAGVSDPRILDAVKESAGFLMKGLLPFEFRTTVVEELHCVSDMESIAEALKGGEKYYLQTFAPSPNTLTSGLSAPADERLDSFLAALRRGIPGARIRGRHE